MNGSGDTIAAIATAAGSAGIGVIRVSGSAAAEILGRLSRRAPLSFVDRRLGRNRLFAPDGSQLDDALCVLMRAPRSFTGEDVVEIHGHGGGQNLGRLLRAVLDGGARLALPGEFSRRAMAAGKLDLMAAEAMLAVVEAGSERALRIAQSQLSGALGDRIAGLESRVVELLARLEAAIDFPEEGLELGGPASLVGPLESVTADCAGLVASYAAGRALREGIEVALRGPVNVGKSSLFNALIGSERALVAAEPGTTRDFLEARLVWDGVPVTLIDTAGERTAEGALERRGIALGAQRAAEADLEVWLVPANEPPAPSPRGEGDGVAKRRRIDVVSKADLGGTRLSGARLSTSANTGAGVAELRSAIIQRALGDSAVGDGDAVVTTARQRDGLATCGAALGRATEAAREARPEEVLALELREARVALAAVRGRGVSDEVLDALFARFCIGK